MNRLTTNEPVGNIGVMLNMVYVKDNEVYLRRLGENDEDISLVNYCRQIYEQEYGKLEKDISAVDFGEYMDDDTLLSVFYWACVGYAEVRERLMKYEDADPFIIQK